MKALPPFIPNTNFAADFMADQGPDAAEGLAKVAEAAVPTIEAQARGIGAPWVPQEGHELIEVQILDDRACIVNTDYAAELQEFGGRYNPPHAPLRTGCLAAGLRVEAANSDAE